MFILFVSFSTLCSKTARLSIVSDYFKHQCLHKQAETKEPFYLVSGRLHGAAHLVLAGRWQVFGVAGYAVGEWW